MGLWSLLSGWRSKTHSAQSGLCRAERGKRQASVTRRCRFETMEERRLLDADPIKVGVTYLEQDGGSDLHGDAFQVLFEGGAPDTELTRVVIDGDHGPSGLSVGDMIFDTVKGGLGADEAFSLQIVSSTGIDHVSWQVSDGGTSLVFEFRGFNAGEKLVFSVDVDEIQQFDPDQTDLHLINEGVDPIASGVEFQGSHLTAEFEAPHYHDVSGTSEFRNHYDALFTGSQLLISQGNTNGLPNDDFQGQRDRSTGTMLQLQQTPLPVTIAGRVFADNNRNLLQDGADVGLSGVSLALWKKVNGQWTFTGHTTTTNGQGDYEFGLNLNLQPGVYEVRETQPADYISVGAIPGDVSGTPTGQTVPGNPDVLTEINIPLGGTYGVHYNFAETQRGSLSGHVELTRGANDCEDESAQNTPLPGVKLTLKDAGGNVVATTFTDENGDYRFDDLLPGSYTIVEETPTGLVDGDEHIGTINGIQVGTVPKDDIITGIAIEGGQDGVHYDFCELLPVSVGGNVHLVTNANDCEDETALETPLSGVKVTLLDSAGNVVGITFTDQQGDYVFNNLLPGVYTIVEETPPGLIDGDQHIGTIEGVAVGVIPANDTITSIVLVSGQHGIDYDFCELLPVSIAGHVWADTIPDCIVQPEEQPIAGVTIQLFDDQGKLIATTLTNSSGDYKFDDLPPGVYTVHELQPPGYLQGGQVAGSHGGDDTQDDILAQVPLKSGDHGVDYNFCEVPPGQISGYVFRDGPLIFSPNGKIPANLYDIRDGQLTADDLRLPGVLLELRHTLTGDAVLGEELLLGKYPPGPVRVLTDGNGYYQFNGLPQGNYSIFEVQPNGYSDSRDTAGTTSGLAVNIGTFVNPLTIQTFAAHGVNLNNDAILQVPLGIGQHSQLNNFSEVQVFTIIIPPEKPPRTPEPPPETPPFIPPPIILPPQIYIPPPAPQMVTGGGGGFTWHLSIIDAGLPRVARRSTRQNGLVFRPALWIEKTEWQPEKLKDGTWTIHGAEGVAPHAIFGIPGAIPVVGDFNGDGKDEIGIYYKGEWFLDLNASGQWDPEDLWAKLGTKLDRPVTGDWDGDGKDDIGIFGPEWPGDPVHLENEPGLPDQDNQRMVKLMPKNMPLNPEEATDGERLMRLTSQGKERADLIDHVFKFGGADDIPIAGDWNGDGIRSVGIFRNGKWHFDMDGDGHWSPSDKTAYFGQKGDLPVVGDFNGDGVEEIAIFRSGKWIIDTNGNREIDAGDQVIELGQAGDLPIAGDFNGDGVDEPAIYRPSEAAPDKAQ